MAWQGKTVVLAMKHVAVRVPHKSHTEWPEIDPRLSVEGGWRLTQGKIDAKSSAVTLYEAHFTQLTAVSCYRCRKFDGTVPKAVSYLPSNSSMPPLGHTIHLPTLVTTSFFFYRPTKHGSFITQSPHPTGHMITAVLRTAIKQTPCINNVTALTLICFLLVTI
jgi:hypothetical protein